MLSYFTKKMTKFLSFNFILFFASMAMATSIPNTSRNPKTFLGPSAALSVTKSMSENSAFSIAGEGGPRNLRLGGTIGWEMNYCQRIKATAELLRQKLTYSFFDGRQSAWMNQGALGVAYLYDFHESVPYNTQFDLSAYISHAPSRTLGTSSGTFINADGDPQNYTVVRRVAGSNGAGISPGIGISPWMGTHVGLQLNYDNVRYDTAHRNSANAQGLGGTVYLNQALTKNVNLGLSAAVRAPYNEYQANIAWNNVPCAPQWIFRVYGDYAIGKNTLPTTYNVGIGADYLVDAVEEVQVPASPAPMPRFKDQPTPQKRLYKDQRVYKDQILPPMEWEEGDATNKNLLKWTSIPAVKIPTVLAVPDQKLTITTSTTSSVCVPPTLIVPFGAIDTGLPFSRPLSANFSGSDLQYSIDYGGQPNNGSLFVSNGNLVGNGPVGGGGGPPNYPGILPPAFPTPPSVYLAITITATNACGSAVSDTFTIE